MIKNILIKAAILGCVGIVLGAFGAHALKAVLTPEQLASFNTGVRYQIIHAVVLLFLFLIVEKFELKQFKLAANFIFFGVILFSGSIYILTLKNILAIDALKFAGPITPIGGLLMIFGWLFIFIGAGKLKK
ncbi:MAG: DUF423 domain-containing protein [Flavobacteriales bacterium]|nr:DUF423 domain-containing protein [Flavobacteriales bacterium]MCB9363915.1 DUF423 domain-containing protein [Flavobacteriales bacterium]